MVRGTFEITTEKGDYSGHLEVCLAVSVAVKEWLAHKNNEALLRDIEAEEKGEKL